MSWFSSLLGRAPWESNPDATAAGYADCSTLAGFSRGDDVKILMTADNLGGVWTYALDLAAALEPFGVEITLATMGRRLTAPHRAAIARDPRLARLSIEEGDFELEWMDAPWDGVARAGDWLLDLEERIEPDIIHFNNYAQALLPFRAPKLVVTHSCLFSWWRAVHGSYPQSGCSRYHATVEAALRSAQQVIAPSRAMLDDIRSAYDMSLRTSTVIPNGRAMVPHENVKKENCILSVGRVWDRAKNIEALASIASRLSWPVVVAGSSSSPDGRSSELRDVILLGELPAEELRWEYSRAGIYVHPALFEPFGLAVLEAAAAGCALVLSDIPSLRENWEGAAVFAPPHQPELLRERIEALIADPVARRELADRAHERSRGFSVTRMADAYLSKYKELRK